MLRLRILALVLTFAGLSDPAAAEPVADFYRGKQIRVCTENHIRIYRMVESAKLAR